MVRKRERRAEMCRLPRIEQRAENGRSHLANGHSARARLLVFMHAQARARRQRRASFHAGTPMRYSLPAGIWPKTGALRAQQTRRRRALLGGGAGTASSSTRPQRLRASVRTDLGGRGPGPR